MFWNSRKNIVILEFPRKFQKKLWNFGIPWEIPKFQSSKVFWKMFWNSRKNIGILEFPRKFKKKNFGILEFPRKFPKKNGILEFPRKFQKKNFVILEFWNFRGNSKIPKFFWNFRGNSKIPIFFLEFQNIFQKTLEFWNFGIFEEIPKFQSFFGIFEEIPKFQNFYLNSKTSSKKLWNFGISQEKSSLCGQAICLSCLLTTAHLFCYPKVGLWTVAWHSGNACFLFSIEIPTFSLLF